MLIAQPATSEIPGVDPEFAERALGWTQCVVVSVLCWGMVWALGIPGFAKAMPLANDAPRWVLALWPLVYGFACYNRERFLRDPSFAWTRGAVMVLGLVALGSLGAGSKRVCDASWGTMLLVGPCWGQFFPRNRVVLVGTMVIPPLERAAFGDGTARSIGAALVVSGVALVLYLSFSARRVAQRSLERRALRAQHFGAATAEEAGALVTSMRLHDGLSGALFLARSKMRQADATETIRVGRGFARQARLTLGAALQPSGGPADARTLEDDLRRFAAESHVPLLMTVEPGAQAGDPAWREAREILVELIANEARHGGGDEVEVHVNGSRRGIECRVSRGELDAPAKGGRGRRNLVLRLEAWGGTFESRDGGLRFTLPWLSASRGTWLSLWLVEGIFHVWMPFAVWFQTHDIAVTVVFAVMVGGLVAVVFTNGTSVGHTRRIAQRALEDAIAASAGPERLLVGRAMSPVLDRLGRAADDDDDVAVRETADELSTILEDLLWSLEVPPESPEVQLALKDLSQRLAVSFEDRSHDGTREALYAARREIRERARARLNARAHAGLPPEPPQHAS